MSIRVDAAGDKDPCSGSSREGERSKRSSEDLVDGNLGSVPVRAAEANNVGIVATDGDGTWGSGGVEQAVLEEELDCEGGAVGLGVLRLGNGGERDMTRGDDGSKPVGTGGPPEHRSSATVAGVRFPARGSVEGELIASVAGLTGNGVGESGVNGEESTGLDVLGRD